MENKTNESYAKIWKHLADKYNSDSASVEDILKEKSLHLILNRYFSELSEAEKNSLIDELHESEKKMNIPSNERL
ncbi:MAG: hypothetical protein LBR81_09700 [Prevotellaceae bacterium]|jgi:hypothetical protein|nr:hypothetical protein [Prevotellaceae bacterium]